MDFDKWFEDNDVVSWAIRDYVIFSRVRYGYC